MPQGYYTIEQWKRPKWVAVAVLPIGLSQTAAEQALQRMGRSLPTPLISDHILIAPLGAL